MQRNVKGKLLESTPPTHQQDLFKTSKVARSRAVVNDAATSCRTPEGNESQRGGGFEVSLGRVCRKRGCTTRARVSSMLRPCADVARLDTISLRLLHLFQPCCGEITIDCSARHRATGLWRPTCGCLIGKLRHLHRARRTGSLQSQYVPAAVLSGMEMQIWTSNITARAGSAHCRLHLA